MSEWQMTSRLEDVGALRGQISDQYAYGFLPDPISYIELAARFLFLPIPAKKRRKNLLHLSSYDAVGCGEIAS